MGTSDDTASKLATLLAIPMALVAILAMFLFVVALAVLILQPFEGAFTRLRAHHTPKGMSLDGWETRINHQLGGPVSAFRRTIKLEGWRGVYKGASASVIATFLTGLPYILFVFWAFQTGRLPDLTQDEPAAPLPSATSMRLAKRVMSSLTTPAADSKVLDKSTLGIVSLVNTVVMSFVAIPLVVICNRAVVTPYRLPSSIGGSLRILLSRRERQRPYVMYTPLLLISTALILITPVIVIACTEALSALSPPVRLGITLGVNGLTALWVVPLKVIMVKASVQPNLLPASTEEEQVALMTENEDEVNEDTEGVPRCSSTDEDVVNIRPAFPKYTSLVQTARTIVEEEGWQALYRGWVWTTLGLLLAAAGTVPPLAH